MKNQIRSEDELADELRVQLHLLRKAAHEFDNGDIHEFRNMARSLRVILTRDDHGNACLVELAGMRSTQFLDTRMAPHSRSIAPYFALVGIVLGPQTVGCRALLGDAPIAKRATLGDWLNQDVIDDKEAEIFNRLRLIKAVSNLAGGTHYPPDVRAYFSKLQDLGVTAVRDGQNVEQKYTDVEKHSIRQIAHEVIMTFDPSYYREGRFEAGALMIGPAEMFLYPGRKIQISVMTKVKAAPAVMLSTPPHGFNGIGGPVIELPYKGTGRKAPCPCGSRLKFRDCCAEPHEFEAAFIDEFERRYALGKYNKA